MITQARLRELAQKVMDGKLLGLGEGIELASIELDSALLFELFALAGAIRIAYHGNKADLCAIVSAKTGACTQDCAYCAQSSRSRAAITTHPLMDEAEVLRRAEAARTSGARRFSIVISGARPDAGELKRICALIGAIARMGLWTCASLGMLGLEELSALRAAGLQRYHHNLEASREFFPRICSSHAYEDKLRTIEDVRRAGLSLCSGGIVGMGETWADRVSLALEARTAGAASVPVNFLHPIAGTPLGKLIPLGPLEALKVISVFRFLLPQTEVRLAGGRLTSLGEFNSMVFMAGADGLITGDCLTTAGRDPQDDIKLARAYYMEH